MTISRRSLLFGTVSAIAVSSFMQPKTSEAHITIASSSGDKNLLMKMIRVLYPHDRFPDGPYKRTSDDVIKKGNSNPAKALMLRAGILELKANSFDSLSFNDATKYLKSIEGTDFFNHVRGTSVVTFYNDKEVWKLLGYEGYSFDQGGYINRGFNDLDWLPDPRITEHPELASFLKKEPNKFVSLKLNKAS